MRVDDLLQQHQQQHQFYVNPTHHNPMTNQQQAQYSNIGSQNCKLVKANHRGRQGSALLFLADLSKNYFKRSFLNKYEVKQRNK